MYRKTLTALAAALAFVSLPAVVHAEERRGDDSATTADRGSDHEDGDSGPRIVHGEDASTKRLTVAPLALFPLGSLSDHASLGVGAGVGFETDVSELLSVTAKLGYVHGFDQTQTADQVGLTTPISVTSSMDNVLVTGGVRVYVTEQARSHAEGGLYVSPELGVGMVSTSTTVKVTDPVSGMDLSSTSSGRDVKIVAAASAGYRSGGWDASLGFVALDIGHPDESAAVLASLGYAFGL